MQNPLYSSGQQIALFRIRPEDWLLWRSLRLQALAEAPYAFNSRLADWQGSGDLEARWRERLASVPFNLIAFLNGTPVGMVSATRLDQDQTAELISLWVAPLSRGHGVGDILVDAVIQWATKESAACLSLVVTEGNQHAAKFYLRRGFVEVDKPTTALSEAPMERRFLRNLR